MESETGLTFPAKCRCLHSWSISSAKGVCFIAGILIFIGLFITFSHANAVVKREIAKQSRRSLTSLSLIVCNLLGCILFIYYMFQDQKLYLRYLFVYLNYCWDVGQRYRWSIVLCNMSIFSTFLYLCMVYLMLLSVVQNI